MSQRELPPHLVASFQEAFFKDHGYALTDEQAQEYGQSLMDLVMTLAGHPAAVRSVAKKFESRSVPPGIGGATPLNAA